MTNLDSLRQDLVDGVPVVWADGPGPLCASLLFRVGRADEGFATGGVTRLVEHAVLRAVGPMDLDTRATVGTWVTTFEASGSADQVVEFLTRVCEALGEPALDDLTETRRQLRARAAQSPGSPAATAASLRYGVRGAGLLASEPLPGVHLDADAVRGWVAQWFTRENALLALSGPVPDDLRLDLAPGVRRTVPMARPRPVQLPAWDNDRGRTAVSISLPATDTGWLATGRLLLGAVDGAVRGDHGLARNVSLDVVFPDARTVEVTVFADNPSANAEQVAALMLDEVDRLATTGPSPQSLEQSRAEARQAFEDPRCTWDAIQGAAIDVLLGLVPTTSAEALAETTRRSADDVRQSVAQAAQTALVLLPDGATLDRPGFTRLPLTTHPMPAGLELEPRLFGGSSSLRLVVAETGLAVRLPEGGLVAPWGDVVGVTVRADGTYVVQTGDGARLCVRPQAFRGGQSAIDVLRAAVPARLVLAHPDDVADLDVLAPEDGLALV